MIEANGGRRPGSGRKPGSANIKTREIADKAAKEGITPLEVMIRAMRAHVVEADRLHEEAVTVELVGEGDTRDTVKELRKASLVAITAAAAVAKDAAVYMHPRLATITANVDANLTGRIQIVSEFPDGD